MDTALKNKLSELSPSQLKELIKKMGKEKKEMPKMARNEAQLYPVTSAQKRMWFLANLDPNSYLYTNPIGIRVKSKTAIDIDLFVEGFKTVVQRHEIMRTSFVNKEGQIFQQIHTNVSFDIDKIDLSVFSDQEKEQRLLKILEQEGQQIIDIKKFPLFHFKQLTLSANEFVFIYTSHHIISDAWSSSFIFRSMQEIYEQKIKNPNIKFPSLKYQFIDYVNWEQNWLDSSSYKQAITKWKQMLPQAPEPLSLPLDFKRPKAINYEGALYKTKFNKEFVNQLRIFSKQHGINLFHTLLSCFNITLYKYAQNEEVVVGIPMSNRKLKEFQETIGMFLNTLPHRTTINKQLSYKDYLQQVKQVSQNMMTHQDVPFDKITEILNPERNLAISPLFQVLFVFQNIPAMYEWDNLAVSPVKTDYSVSKYDLNLWVEEVSEELILSMTCQTSLFRKEMMPQFINYYKTILKAVLLNPTQTIGEIALSKDIIEEPKINTKKQNSYVFDFENHVKKHPTRLALKSKDETYNYKELNEKVNLVANYLLKIIKNEKLIGLALGRSPEMLITLLAVHKIGVAYLPIDEQLPKKRLQFILKDSGINTVITNKELTTKFDSFSIKTLIFDTIIHAEKDIKNPNIEVLGESLAYVMYTSGSTGNPKGVCIEHSQITNYSKAIWEKINGKSEDNFASISAFTTDLGNTQIFPALMHCACITIFPDDSLMDPIKFSECIKKYSIDYLKIVPSYLKSLLSINEGAAILPRKLLILGGEAIPASLIIKIRNLKSELRIINHYGPTETTIGVLTHEIGEVSENDIIPIGKPLANNTVLIIGENSQQLPKGIPGEIVIQGNNVGRGYINNQISENKNFITDEVSNIRSYKTGDLGRINYDGTIQFLGRKDRQIKIRGFRIEINEVEKSIAINSLITDVVVHPKNEQTLVAYLVGDINEKTISMIKQELKFQLPSYMIPNEFVVLSEIPRLGNGKVNTKALASFSNKSTTEVSTSIQPRDEVELAIKNIWQEILKQNIKSITVDFFDAGGNSLMAIEIIAKLNKHFKIDLTIGVLFECPTIQSLANKIRNGQYNSSTNSLVLLRKGTSNNALFFIHPAGGDVFSYYNLTQHIDARYAVYGLQAKKVENPSEGIKEIAQNYIREIKEQLPNDINLAFGGWSMGALIAYEMAQIHKIQTNKLAPVIILDQKAPLLEINDSLETLEKLSVFGEKINHLVGQKTQLTKESLANLNDFDRSKLFLNEFKKNNLVPKDLKPEEFHGFLDVMLYHNEITMKYKAAPYNGSVLLIKALELTFIDDTEENSYDYGWNTYATNQLSVIEVPGNHITIIRKPNVEEVGNQINLYLKETN